MKHVVNFSGGIGSFWAAHRVIQKHGPKDVVLLFVDVKMEDPDLYRFLDDAEECLGVPITRIAQGMTPWELFAKEGMIGNTRAPLCSVRLKREVLDAWHVANTLELTTTIHIGIDWTEEHRLHDLRKRKPTWRIEAPMCEAPFWDKCRMLEELKPLGIEAPLLYRLGFPHNNCGGMCVKAGQAQFALLLKTLPVRYAYHEEQEQKLREQVGDYSILRDRRGLKSGDKPKPLTLARLRERIESGDYYDREDWGGCGCTLEP